MTKACEVGYKYDEIEETHVGQQRGSQKLVGVTKGAELASGWRNGTSNAVNAITVMGAYESSSRNF